MRKRKFFVWSVLFLAIGIIAILTQKRDGILAKIDAAPSSEVLLKSEKREEEFTRVATDELAGDYLSVEFSNPSKLNIEGYSDLVNMTLEAKTTDLANALHNGKLVLKIGKGLELSDYTKASSAILNYQYDYKENTLTYWLKDELSTTGIPQIGFSVKAGILAGKAGVSYNVEVEMTGETPQGNVYEKASTKTSNFTVTGTSYVAASPSNYSFNGTNNLIVKDMSGSTRNLYMTNTVSGGGTLRVENLIVKTEALNEAAKSYFPLNRVQPITTTGLEGQPVGDRLVTTTTSNYIQTSETGSFNLIQGGLATWISFKIPQAEPGTVFEYQYSLYDGNQLLATTPIRVEVAQVTTTVTYSQSVQSDIDAGAGYVDQFTVPYVSTGGKGVSQNESIYVVPQGLIPEGYSFRNGTPFGGIYYQYDNDSSDTWNSVTEKVGDYGLTFKNVANKEKIRKLKVVYPDTLTGYTINSPNAIRYSYSKAEIGDKYIIENESNSYFDNNTEKKVNGAKSSSLTIMVKDFAKSNAELNASTFVSGYTVGSSIANGSSFTTKFSLSNSLYAPLRKPYKFVIVPKGVSFTRIGDAMLIPYLNQAQYNYSNSTYRVVPGTQANFTKIEQLSDGSTMYLTTDSESLTKANSTYDNFWKTDFRFNVETALMGEHQLIFGSGAVESDQYTNANKVLLTDPSKGVTSEVRKILEENGITSKSFIPLSTTFNIRQDDTLQIYSKVKLSTEKDYIDVTSEKSLMEAVPGQAIDYQAEIKNTGTTEMKEVSVVDILPYDNDTDILSQEPRKSQFRLFLTGPVKDLKKNGTEMSDDQYNLMYSTSKTPQRWNSNGGVVAGDPWEELPESITDVQSFKLELADSLLPGDSILLNFKLQVPADAPRSTDTDKYQAHNTIAYHSATNSAESNWATVQTKLPGALEISGTVFDDANVDGQLTEGEERFNSQKVMLYHKTGSAYEYVEERLTTEANGEKGLYVFNEKLINGDTYKVGVDFTDLIDAGYTPLEISSQFASVKLDKPNADGETIGWLLLDGREEFIVSDKAITGHAPVYELNAPVFKATPLETTVAYQYLDQSLSKKKALPSKGMKIALQQLDGTPVKGNDNKDLVATVGDYGKASFGNIPLAAETTYQVVYPDSHSYKLKYMNDKNKATVTVDKVKQETAKFNILEAAESETATFSFTTVTQGDAIVATVYTTAYDVLRFGDVSDTLEFGTNGILPLSIFDKKTSPQPFKLEVEDTRVVKEEKWKVSATIATDLQAVEKDQVVATLPGALGYANTTSGTTTFDAFQPNVPYVIHEVTGIQEGDADNTVNIPKEWTTQSGIVLDIPAGTPKLKTYSTEITWTLTASPY